MSTTWTISIDWERAGTFDGTYDNITTRIISANWFLGFRKPYTEVADDSMLQLVLNNSDKRFSPEYASSPLADYLVPFRPVRIQSNDGVTIRTHYSGWIESIEPKVNQFGERTVTIMCAGPMLIFEGIETSIELQENKRTDEIIAELLREVMIPPPLVDKAIIDMPGVEIDAVDIVGSTVISNSLDQGKTVLAYAADNWVQQGKKASFNVYKAINDTVAAERGRFFFNREGQAIFWNRHKFIMHQTLEATFDNSMMDMGYSFADQGEFANNIKITCHPRTISDGENDLLWSLEEPITIDADKEREVGAPFKDESDNRIGGRNIRLENVTFKSETGFIEGKLVLQEKGANRATLRLFPDVKQKKRKIELETAEIHGQKITDFGQMEAEASDGLSIVKYGRRDFRLDLNSVDNQDDAQAIADFELVRRKQPSGKVQSITLRSHGKNGGGPHAGQLARTIGDRIRVKEEQSEHDGQYFIIGETHKLTDAATKLESMWYLESATEGNWCVIDSSDIDAGAILLPY